jgi:hypothetical protein
MTRTDLALETLVLLWEGPRSINYGHTATLRLIVQILWWRWRERWSLFLIFSSNWASVEWSWQGKTEVLGQKSVSVPLCTPQIPHGPTRVRNRASAVRSRQLTAWAMSRPKRWFTRHSSTWRGCKPENILLNSVAMKASNYIWWKVLLTKIRNTKTDTQKGITKLDRIRNEDVKKKIGNICNE